MSGDAQSHGAHYSELRPDGSGSKSLTVEGYVSAIQEFSKLQSGAGQNHERLATFLSPLLNPLTSNIHSPNAPGEGFLTLYRLSDEKPDTTAQNTSTSPSQAQSPEKVINFRSYREFEDFEPPSPNEARSELFFLKGRPSPEWLGLIGSKYRVDPEFFSRHLDYRSMKDKSRNFALPSLPSPSWYLMQLVYTTIGSRDTMRTQIKQDEISKLRKDTANAMENYFGDLYLGSDISMGDSTVRQLSIYDEKNFTIEQRISICMHENEKSWAVFAWLDSGNDDFSEILKSVNGPWSLARNVLQSHGTFLHPVIKHRRDVALKPQLMLSNEWPTPSHQPNAPQSAALLPLNYGKSLKPDIMSYDAFYALNEMFTFVAFSEMQFLNMIEFKLDRYLEDNDSQEYDSLPKIKYVKNILYRHIQHIKETIASIQNTRHPKWPKGTRKLKGKEQKAARAAEALDQDFHHLLERTQFLYTRCHEEIGVLMNSIAIQESKRAIRQAERVEKLTFLAFIFVPMSFTSSFFGMNVKELGTDKISIWAWIIVTFSVLALTLLLFFYNSWKKLWSFFRRAFDGLFAFLR